MMMAVASILISGKNLSLLTFSCTGQLCQMTGMTHTATRRRHGANRCTPHDICDDKGFGRNCLKSLMFPNRIANFTIVDCFCYYEAIRCSHERLL